MSTTTAEKRIWIYEQQSRLGDAIAALQAAKKQATTSFDTELRGLRAYAESLRVTLHDSQQFELFDCSHGNPPKIEERLVDPLHGLIEPSAD